MLDKSYPDLKALFINAYNDYLDVDKEALPIFKKMGFKLASKYQQNNPDREVTIDFGDFSPSELKKFDELTVKLSTASMICETLRQELFDLINRQMQFLTTRLAYLKAKELREDWEDEELDETIPSLILELDDEIKELNSKYSVDDILKNYQKINDGVRSVALSNGYKTIDVDGRELLVPEEEADDEELIQMRKMFLNADNEKFTKAVNKRAYETFGLPPRVDKMIREELEKISPEDIVEFIKAIEDLMGNDDDEENQPK